VFDGKPAVERKRELAASWITDSRTTYASTVTTGAHADDPVRAPIASAASRIDELSPLASRMMSSSTLPTNPAMLARRFRRW
jgi:hypothetical protein